MTDNSRTVYFTGIIPALSEPKATNYLPFIYGFFACLATVPIFEHVITEQLAPNPPPDLEVPVRPNADFHTAEGRYIWDDYRRRMEGYAEYKRITAHLKTAIYQSLDEFDKIMVAPGGNYNEYSLRHILGTIYQTYGRLHHNDIALLEDALTRKMLSHVTIQEHITMFRKTCNSLAAANMAKPEPMKVLLFLRSLPHTPKFDAFVDWFNLNHEDLATRLLDDCFRLLISYKNNHDLYHAETSTQGLANVANAAEAKPITSPVIDALEKEIRDLKAAAARQKSKTERAKTQTTRPPTQTMRSNVETWCWSHGKCFHNSQQCNRKLRGHVREATEEDPRDSPHAPLRPKPRRRHFVHAATLDDDADAEEFEQFLRWRDSRT